MNRKAFARRQRRAWGYPWDRWFKRKTFRLVRGKNFDCAPHSMSVQVRGAAHKRDIRVSVFIEGDVLIVTKVD